MAYGYFCFWLSVAQSRPAVAGAGRDADLFDLLLHWMVMPVRIAGKMGLRGVADGGWRELDGRPQWGCCGRELRRAVRGHGEFLPVDGAQCSGARG
jgi:hypothetical protein